MAGIGKRVMIDIFRQKKYLVVMVESYMYDNNYDRLKSTDVRYMTQLRQHHLLEKAINMLIYKSMLIKNAQRMNSVDCNMSLDDVKSNESDPTSDVANDFCPEPTSISEDNFNHLVGLINTMQV